MYGFDGRLDSAFKSDFIVSCFLGEVDDDVRERHVLGVIHLIHSVWRDGISRFCRIIT